MIPTYFKINFYKLLLSTTVLLVTGKLYGADQWEKIVSCHGGVISIEINRNPPPRSSYCPKNRDYRLTIKDAKIIESIPSERKPNAGDGSIVYVGCKYNFSNDFQGLNIIGNDGRRFVSVRRTNGNALSLIVEASINCNNICYHGPYDDSGVNCFENCSKQTYVNTLIENCSFRRE